MIITILIFVAILAVLIFVHEFGHFIVAKKSGMQVEEFGFGFPPRLAGIQKTGGKWKWVWGHKEVADKDQTVYSINWIPLGGFVRILGENNEHQDNPGSFINKGFWPRFLTLVAGVIMNVLLAWVLLSIGFSVGLPVAVNNLNDVPKSAHFVAGNIAILEVVKDLPADKAGLKPNDIILGIDGQKFSAVEEVQKYVKDHAGQSISFNIKRGQQQENINVVPTANPPAGEGPTGIALALIGKLKYPVYSAFWEGAKTTWSALTGIVSGLYNLIASHSGFSNLGGPVKIAKLTGEVAGMGFIYLLQFTAFLSLNLAVLNILPFPALDGGRVLFLLIEVVRRKKNNQKVEQIVNGVGFALLLLLMVVVTIHDLIKK
ncbi:MAG: RIP metalloprotease RseP [Candidatus Doudnabacteria bacterium]|nr:RIP metalloprotease RseP [Candidatus Doudnabacteria bacterium]